MTDPAGKTALITGGASGIGLALAHALAAAGADVAVADIDAARLAAAVESLRAQGAKAHGVALDVADPAAWERAVDEVERALGPVRILANNAGVGTGANDVVDMPIAHWNWALGVNLTGVFLGAKTIVGRLRTSKLSGHIVNTASIMGFLPIAKQAAYVATKYAVVGLSEVMRIDFAASGVGVSVLCPGLVATPLRANSMALRPGGGGEGFGFVPADGRLAARPAGMPAEAVADMVLDAIRANRFYVFPHPEYRDAVAQRMQRVLGGFGDSALPGYADDPSFLAADSRRLFGEDM